MSTPIEVTDATFQKEVLESDVPVLVDFWAGWCAPCRMIAPSVKEIAKEFDGKAKVCKVDVDANMEISRQFGIRSIPTLLYFKDGEVKDQVIGAVPKDQLVRRLEPLVA